MLSMNYERICPCSKPSCSQIFVKTVPVNWDFFGHTYIRPHRNLLLTPRILAMHLACNDVTHTNPPYKPTRTHHNTLPRFSRTVPAHCALSMSRDPRTNAQLCHDTIERATAHRSTHSNKHHNPIPSGIDRIISLHRTYVEFMLAAYASANSNNSQCQTNHQPQQIASELCANSFRSIRPTTDIEYFNRVQL